MNSFLPLYCLPDIAKEIEFCDQQPKRWIDNAIEIVLEKTDTAARAFENKRARIF